jgi:hypothetical protein
MGRGSTIGVVSHVDVTRWPDGSSLNLHGFVFPAGAPV